MTRRMVLFMSIHCPICRRVLLSMKKLSVLFNVHLIIVDVEEGFKDSLVAEYYYIMKLLGGEKRVPIVLLDDDKWFLPRITSTGKHFATEMEKIEYAVAEFEKKIAEELKKPYVKTYFPTTHEEMRKVFHWRRMGVYG